MKIIAFFLLMQSMIMNELSTLKDIKYKEKLKKNALVIKPLSQNEVNCLYMRKLMKSLPSYSSVQDGFKAILMKRPKRTFKSYRKLILNLLQKFVFDDSQEDIQQEKSEILQTIKELKRAKKMFFKKYKIINSQFMKNEASKAKDLREKISVLKQDLEKKEKNIKKKNQMKDSKLSQINNIFKNNSEIEKIQKKLNQYEKFEDFHDQVFVAFRDQQSFLEFKQNIEKKFPGNSIIEKFKNLYEQNIHLNNLFDLKDTMTAFEEFTKPNGSNTEMMNQTSMQKEEITHDIDQLKKQIEDQNEIIKDLIDDIQTEIKSKMNKLISQLSKFEEYEDYTNLIDEIVEIKKEIKHLKDRKLMIENEISIHQNEMENLDIDDYDFALAQDLELKLEKHILFLDNNNVNVQNFKLYSNKDFFDKYGDYFNKFTRTDLPYQMKRFYEDKLEMVQKINQLESVIDKKFGGLVHDLQFISDDKRCFSLPNLSYLFFSLVKINAVIKETDFLEGFFGKAKYIHAKEFIIYNYGLIADNAFIEKQFNLNDMKDSLIQKSQDDQQLIKSVYINNWCFLINVYKEYTEFGLQSSDQSVKTVGIGRKLLSLMKLSANKLIEKAKDKGADELIGFIVGKIMTLIPFVGSLASIFESIITAVVGYIVNFIIDLIIRFVTNHKSEIKMIWNKFKGVFKALRKKEIYSLDYLNVIHDKISVNKNDDLDLEEEIDLKIKIDKIEKTYKEAVQKELNDESRFNSKVFIFEKSFNTLSPLKLIDKVIEQDVQKIKSDKDIDEDMVDVINDKLHLIEINKEFIKQGKFIKDLAEESEESSFISEGFYLNSKKLKNKRRSSRHHEYNPMSAWDSDSESDTSEMSSLSRQSYQPRAKIRTGEEYQSRRSRSSARSEKSRSSPRLSTNPKDSALSDVDPSSSTYHSRKNSRVSKPTLYQPQEHYPKQFESNVL
jgi:hypothetical protein